MAACEEKRRYGSRMAAETALSIARAAWRRAPQRASQPPVRIYQCSRCLDWHLTHKEKDAHLQRA